MTVEESDRHLLHQQAAQAMGPEAAAILMSHLPPAGWADLARRADVEHETALLRAEISSLRTELGAEIGSVRTELGAEIGSVRAELGAKISSVRTELGAEIDSVRAELAAETGSVRADMETLRAQLVGTLEARMSRHLRWTITLFTVMAGWLTAVQALVN